MFNWSLFTLNFKMIWLRGFEKDGLEFIVFDKDLCEVVV